MANAHDEVKQSKAKPSSSLLDFHFHRIYILPFLSSGGGGSLLASLNRGLGTDATKDESDAEPLLAVEPVVEPEDGEEHGEHLASDGDGDEDEGGEVCESVDYKKKEKREVSNKERDTG